MMNTDEESHLLQKEHITQEAEALFPTSTKPLDPELENFLSQVDSISEVVRCLSSNDRSENERGLRKADILLQDGGRDKDIDETQIQVRSDRTVINKTESHKEDEGEMSQSGFMRMVEKDAKERARNRKMKKEHSDKLRDEGIQHFRKENYAAALDRFNKAIEWTKDSPVLYNNRALTYIRLQIYSKAIEDCDKAIQISENNLKARLYKAKAYFSLGDTLNCEKCFEEAFQTNPDSKKIIQDYKEQIFSCKD